ncbi:hypothetical protein [Ralstonia pseudosolanacearum]|uniref:hypothetical protein n=1 Tax=Ralstonia pseudosolanacearum TaxID=1310165 RepID=UPI0018D0398B|nr:hypothetical protein [Ralstonia pseudosolanacearum]
MLGSILMVTDATQATVTNYSYDAYGATTQTGMNDNGQQYTGAPARWWSGPTYLRTRGLS